MSVYFRLVQYSSKFTWYYLQKYGLSEELAVKLQRLSSALSTTRKFMRLGKSVDFLHGALRSIHLADNVLRLTITLSKLNQSVYLLFDHMVWAGRVGLAVIDKDKWGKLSARFWMVTIILNIIRDIYEILGIIYSEIKQRDAKMSRSQYKNGVAEHKQLSRPSMSNRQLLLKCIVENPPAFLDLARNICDAVLPLEALGYIKASPGIQGLTGTVSSVLGIASTWNPLLRLVPS
ncbi:peroxisomal membrane protein 11B-like [Elysia marginata]|uniref:Peroxisomal membrane protein 11B-like n=1 Tax=Elysia marginata TaxID=1093978 RepID=A0AAV4G6N4_9GAST|nr:peroxisomal membrane protein 11B-like [Elysia marginata]